MSDSATPTVPTAYAIDFGTSNTVISRWNSTTQQPETLNLPGLSTLDADNPPLIPSLVYVEDAVQEHIVLGQAVRDRGLDVKQDPRFFRNIKRGIGADVQGFLPDIDGRRLTFDQVGAWYLTQVIRQLQGIDPQVQSLTFTVPVDSFEAYRNWLGQVSKTLDIEQIRLLDEPTAAALGYGVGDRSTLLVIDFGGGTLDLSLVKLEATGGDRKPIGFLLKWGRQTLAETSNQRPKLARVLAKTGQNLGGADVDDWLLSHFSETQGLPVSALTRRLAERLKIQLSSQTTATEVFFNDETFESYELSLDRDRFRQVLEQHHLFERLEDALSQVLQQARRQGLEPADIEAVVLVGGSSRIPAVQEWLQAQFPPEKIFTDRPFEAIAHGALQLSQGLEVKDFLYHGYGIRYWDRRTNRHGWHPLIPQGQPYPMPVPVELVLGASVERQPSIELVIGELGAETGGTEVYFDGDRLVTRPLASGQAMVKPLNDSDRARSLAKLDPLGYPGSDRIRLSFWVDGDRFLRVTVDDLLTNRTLIEGQAVVQLS